MLAAFYREQHVQVIFRRCNAVNARDACDHDGVTARKQCAGRGEPQTLDLFVDRRIFFDVGVGAGDIGFRLVVIEIADGIFNGVARKELFELGVELRGQRFIMGDDERGPIDVADYVRDRKSFSRTGHAEQCLMPVAGLNRLDQLGDGLPLVPSRFVVRFKLKRHLSL